MRSLLLPALLLASGCGPFVEEARPPVAAPAPAFGDVAPLSAEEKIRDTPPFPGQWITGMLGEAYMSLEPGAVEEEPKRFPQGSAAISGAEDFLFVMGQGGALEGASTLKIDASGGAELVFRKGPASWSRARFHLFRRELAELQALLVKIDFFSLKRVYHPAGVVDDGARWFVRVRAGSQRKTVVLDNHFPAPILRLSDLVRVSILSLRGAEMKDAEDLGRLPKSQREPVYWDDDR